MSSGRRLISVTVAAIVVAGAVVAGLEITNITHFFHTSVAQQKQQEAQRQVERKKALTEQESPQKGGNSLPPTTYKTPDSSNNIQLSAAQTGANVTIYTRLYGYSDGSCHVTIASGSHTTSQDAAVIYRPDYAVCAGFEVPVDTLGSGTWQIHLTVTSGGVSLDKTINFEVH